MSVVFFTDRDLGKAFPSILRDNGLIVEQHADHFTPNARDEEWLAETARRGWVAIAHDTRIRYKPNELDAVVSRASPPQPEASRTPTAGHVQLWYLQPKK